MPARALLLTAGFVVATAWGAGAAQPLARPAQSSEPGPLSTELAMRLPSVAAFPRPGSYSQLYGDTCTSRSDCWAVGFYLKTGPAKLGQVLHLHRQRWSPVSVPQPASRRGRGYDYLLGVACSAARNCWTVGYYGDNANSSLDETLHWNGRRWRKIRTPQPAGIRRDDQNQLNAVTCTSASNCWAVGDTAKKKTARLNETLHWNGRKWAKVAAPNPSGTASGEENVLYGVSCSSRKHCLAVGDGRKRAGAYVNEALLWNGTKWAMLRTPQPGGTSAHGFSYLQGIDCISASDCWADGGYLARQYLNEALRWNGKKWTQVPIPGSGSGWGDSELISIACVKRSDCWAVGNYNSRKGERNETLRWDGKHWSRVSTSQPGGRGSRTHTLYAISCRSRSDCWAVGYLFNRTGASLNEALRWDGRRWADG